MIKSISHTAFNTADMERALHFYCDCLGFKRAFSLNNDDGTPCIEYLKVGSSQFIELFYNGTPAAARDKSAVGYNHLCLEVSDIHEIAGLMQRHGIELDVLPKQGKDTNWQCWVRDPDGNRIEFMQLSQTSPQMKAMGGRGAVIDK